MTAPILFPAGMDDLLIERRAADKLAAHAVTSLRIPYATYRRQEYWLARLEHLVARRAA